VARRAAFPGSFNPPTVAHLAMAEAAVRQCSVDAVDFVLSQSALGKETVVRPTVDERAEVLRGVAASRPWLGVVVTEHQLLVDIAEGFSLLVLGADKWEQVLDPVFYGGSIAQRDAALARLPPLAVARRLSHAVPESTWRVTLLDVAHDDVSSTAARAGAVDLMLPEARASGLW
jgi:hypothetical protein